MNPIPAFESKYKFVELHRTFRELSENNFDNDEIDIGPAFRGGKRLRWPDLVKEYRLIILSEAGSGKTAEIRNIAQTLRAQGRPAFFLRLEHIPIYFEEAFEVGTFEAFGEWLTSGEEGWLLLDSVDEARLRNPGDFELAVRILSRRIKAAQDRAHIVITGRTTAWRPRTDLDHCTASLPYAVAAASERAPKEDNDCSDGSLKTETAPPGRTRPGFKIVALEDFSSDQVAKFAKARGVENSNGFLDAVERADAWSFTSRPQDLEELTEFWIDKGRIGSRLEIMQNSIIRRLAERDQSRAEARPLSAERVRQGARLLAAATTLTQDPTIRVPDGAENSKGVAVQSVLSDWDDKGLSILLSRPIFDEAIYGTVRFHHRSVREYLTAEWFDELLNHETSRRKIESLFFRSQYDLDIVVPALRPILPWLAIMNEKIRARVRKVAPEIFFEGGDPSQLPLEVRRYVLVEVCEQMARGATGRSMRDYAAVQRFACPDLTDDVRALLRQYADNEDLTAYLLRMVWLGQIAGALPEAMKVALKAKVGQYTRITAFRAVQAIGSEADQERVRQSFLAEASELSREWFSELLKGVKPTEKTLEWLLACLEKSVPKERYSADHLADAVTEFVGVAEISLLPQLVTGLNRLLSLSPMIERRYCEVSDKFQWLMVPACKAIERLILARHPATLEPDSLDTMNKFNALHGYGSNELNKIKVDFSTLVPAWKDLNRALFWSEVQKSRAALDKKREERLIDFRRASFFGSFWRFEEDDFMYVAEEISRRSLLDDKLVALSLAFHLYKTSNRPLAWRKHLKKLVSGSDELAEALRIYLKPSAQNPESLRWKKQEARWKKQAEVARSKQEKYHAGWLNYFKDNLDKDRSALCDNPGTITNSLLYLFEQTRDAERNTGRWTEYNWKTLISKYGEDVARFYRDSTVNFWRNHKPKLRSEGAPPTETTYAVIIGLVGLEIEAHETKDWPKNLRAPEIELACRYGSFELNGFPTWFPKLFETHPKIVSDFLMGEIQYELSIETPETETHYIISDLSWSGQWAWEKIAPSIYDLLEATEPKNLSNLEKFLKILQGSSLSADTIEKLASTKCRTLKDLHHVACWFAVWTSVAPENAISSFKARIEKISSSEERTCFAMTFVTHLWGDRRSDRTAARQAFKTPEHLKSLYLLMHEYIRVEEDIDRAGKGVFSPGLRDDAQDSRNGLFNLLNQIPGKESFLALLDIAKVHPLEVARPWILHQAKMKAEQDGDIEPWLPSQVMDFHEKFERTPGNHRDLAELAVLRILDLKDDLENGDISVASILKTVKLETEIRKYIAKELREKAFGRYSIPQEEELADAKRPDLRFHGMKFDGPVPVELKLADKWTGPNLFERLENQLCGDYLRDNRGSRGVFLLVYLGEKAGWEVPGRDNRVDFSGLTDALQNHWQQISPRFPKVDDIKVIGIDLTKRTI